MGSPQQVLDLIKELGRGVGKRRIETPDATTILTEETWDGDTTIKRFEFDAIVSLASKTDTPKGAKYSILIKDTPTESITFAFSLWVSSLDRRWHEVCAFENNVDTRPSFRRQHHRAHATAWGG
jgi:hypothetical protein